MIRVWVFELSPGPRGGIPLVAYTRSQGDYDKGGCVHHIDAVNGSRAKRRAIVNHREVCMKKSQP